MVLEKKKKMTFTWEETKGGKSQVVVFEMLYCYVQQPATVVLISCILKLLFAFQRAYIASAVVVSKLLAQLI